MKPGVLVTRFVSVASDLLSRNIADLEEARITHEEVWVKKRAFESCR